MTITKPLLKTILTFPAFVNEEDWYTFVFIAREYKGQLLDSEEGNLQWIADEELLNIEL